MNYEKIWKKTLKEGEEVKYEFSVGNRYRKLWLIVLAVISLPMLFLYGLGLLVFLSALFYFGFYLKVANAYVFTDKRVIRHTGWLSTNIISVDYDKITDISVIEPFFDRILTKTGHLVINTAGTTLHEVILRNIASPYEVKKKLDELRK